MFIKVCQDKLRSTQKTNKLGFKDEIFYSNILEMLFEVNKQATK